MAPVTLKRIAEKTGVSRQTAGRILGGEAHLYHEETVQLVSDAARSLGYRPNLVARSIRAGRTRTVGVMIHVGNDSYTADILLGAHDELLANDYLPVMLLARPGATELEQVHRLLDRRVEGIILQPSGADVSDAYLHEPLERHIPVVTVNTAVPQTRFIDFAGTNDDRGGRLAAEHLYALGHRRLVCIRRDGEAPELALRVNGFIASLRADPGVSVQTISVSYAGGGVADLAELRQILLQPDRPTAVFATMDPLVPAVYTLARELGLVVPVDLSVVGFADLEYARLLSPPLTTLRQDGQEIGRRAARLLIQRLDGDVPKDEVRRVCAEPELVVRGSTAPPKKWSENN